MSDERRRAITSTPRLTPDDVANRTFSSSFRGIAEAEVKAFLQRVADELADSRRREDELVAALAQAEGAADTPRPLSEEELLDALGEETARLLHTARDAARDIRTKAEENSTRMLAEAQEASQQMREEAAGILDVRRAEAEAAAAEIRATAEEDAAELRAGAERAAEEQRLRADAEVEALRADADREADAEIERARAKAREMVDTARDLREKVLADLAHRRALLTEQIGELRSGREKLLEAYRVVKRSFLDATEALAGVEGRAAQDRPETIDPAVVAAALAGEDVVADDTAADLADAVDGDATGEVPVGEVSTGDGPTGEPSGVDAHDVVAPAESATTTAGPAVAADATGGADAGAESDGPDDADKALPDPDDLFARIRAQRASEPRPDTAPAVPSEPTPATEAEPASEPEPEPEPEPEVDDSPSGRARAQVGAAVAIGLRAAKRIAQDDQNALLDALRRQKGRPDSASVLADHAEQAAAWVGALSEAIDHAFDAGRAALGGGTGRLAPELAADLVTAVLDPVRARFAQSIDESDDANEAIERLNARAREFRGQQLEAAVTDILAGVYARGAYEAAPTGSVLQWVLAAEGCSADCADNVLEPTTKGETFPTGHHHPPAYPGCRCALTLTVVDIA